MTFDDFKFNIGDIVRHVTASHNSAVVQTESLAGVITMRSIHQGEFGELCRTYHVHTIENTASYEPECTLELVQRCLEMPSQS